MKINREQLLNFIAIQLLTKYGLNDPSEGLILMAERYLHQVIPYNFPVCIANVSILNKLVYQIVCKINRRQFITNLADSAAFIMMHCNSINQN